jgi:hypothetical protein
MTALIRERMQNGIARLQNCQIMDLGRIGQEVFVLAGEEILPASLGKNATKLFDILPPRDTLLADCRGVKLGNYYYWYTQPLHNYYHCILDGVGQLSRYFALKRELPDLKLLLNQSPKPKGGVVKHPPFVTELLALFDIDWEYTDENIMYDTMYYGDTLGQHSNGRRRRPDDLQYKLLQHLIDTAKQTATAPQYERVYLSRRAHANPQNNRKDIIGEDNTVKRGLTNEDDVVNILKGLGYTEVFGENYTLAEKIVLFNGMEKYISTAGAGVANILWTMPNSVSVGGIHTPGFPFPSNNHESHICCNKQFVKATISLYPGKVKFVDPTAGAKDYNNPWYINNLVAFEKWARAI